MSEKLDSQLTSINDKIQEKYKIQRKLEVTEKAYEEIKKQLDELREHLNKEEADVKKLEGSSITSLFYSILGTKEERMDKEYLAKLL